MPEAEDQAVRGDNRPHGLVDLERGRGRRRVSLGWMWHRKEDLLSFVF